MTENPYTKNAPLAVAITERYNLCKNDSSKQTYHLSLDLEESGFTYEPGDSIGIFAQNNPELVDHLLQKLQLDPAAPVTHPRSQESFTLRDYLLTQASLSNFSKPLLQKFAPSHSTIERLLQPEQKAELKEFIHQHEVWDLTDQYPITITSQELVSSMMPLLPRFYSIASSQKHEPNQLDLTVDITQYTNSGMTRLGVCSDYLCHHIPLGQSTLPIYLHPNPNFRLPENLETPIIMIGPGTGIAPFRAFMQERRQDSTKNWLFFGEWTEKNHYFYQDFWEELTQQNRLKLDLAFSRDQEEKIYVQHRMLESAKELYSWIQDGANIYVCGDAHHMAKDVDHALQEILQQEGNLAPEEAKECLKKLRKERRYLRDIY